MIARSVSPGIFKWGYVFQRGDLPIFITDTAGNPVSPFKVTFTLFRYSKGACGPMRVGPCDRTPVMADVGEYYVSGVAGQCGQPGDWLVEWKFQESFGSQFALDRFGFKVFDTSQYCAGVTYNRLGCGCSSGGCGCTNANPVGSCQWKCLTPSGCGKYGW
jgi:hypothetical protein